MRALDALDIAASDEKPAAAAKSLKETARIVDRLAAAAVTAGYKLDELEDAAAAGRAAAVKAPGAST